MGNLKLIEQLTEFLLACRPAAFMQLENGSDVVLDRESPENRRLLGQIADAEACPAVHRQMRDLCPIERDRALVGGDEPGDHVEHRGLSGAIGSKQSHGLSATDSEADPPHHRPAPIGLGELHRHKAVIGRLGGWLRGDAGTVPPHAHYRPNCLKIG